MSEQEAKELGIEETAKRVRVLKGHEYCLPSDVMVVSMDAWMRLRKAARLSHGGLGEIIAGIEALSNNWTKARDLAASWQSMATAHVGKDEDGKLPDEDATSDFIHGLKEQVKRLEGELAAEKSKPVPDTPMWPADPAPDLSLIVLQGRLHGLKESATAMMTEASDYFLAGRDPEAIAIRAAARGLKRTMGEVERLIARREARKCSGDVDAEGDVESVL